MSKTLINIVLIMVAVILLPAFVIALVTCTACAGTVAVMGVTAASQVADVNTQSRERIEAAAAMMAELDAEVLAKDAARVEADRSFLGYCRRCQSAQQFEIINGLYTCDACWLATEQEPLRLTGVVPDAAD